jgi:hypothetical protein
VHDELGDLRRELEQVRRDSDSAHRQLAELKAAAQVVPEPPPPPLPRGRSSGLDDLRQQLRSAHLEADLGDDV